MTSTTPGVAALDAIAHLDWPVEPCEDDRCAAGHPPATHVLRCLLPCPCSPPELICTACAERWIQQLRPWIGRNACITCLHCGEHYHGVHIPSFYTVKPL